MMNTFKNKRLAVWITVLLPMVSQAQMIEQPSLFKLVDETNAIIDHKLSSDVDTALNADKSIPKQTLTPLITNNANKLKFAELKNSIHPDCGNPYQFRRSKSEWEIVLAGSFSGANRRAELPSQDQLVFDVESYMNIFKNKNRIFYKNFLQTHEDLNVADFSKSLFNDPVFQTYSSDQNWNLKENQVFNHFMLEKLFEVTSPSQIEPLVKANTKNLSFNDQISLASYFAASLPYNDTRATFTTRGSRSMFQMLAGTDENDGGICGDIHTATNQLLKMMDPNLELYTMSYATNYSQHIVSVVKDPGKGPSAAQKLHIINYNNVIEKDGSKQSEPLALNGSDGYTDVGMRYRLYKSKNGDEQNHIGTIKNDLGSFLYLASVNPFEKTAMPVNDRFQSGSVDFKKTKDKSTDSRTVNLNTDYKIFTGQLENGAEVVGLAAKREKLRNLGVDGNVLDKKKFGIFSGTSTNYSYVDYKERGPEEKYFHLYLTNRNYIVTPVIQKKGFSFSGLAGVQVEADMAQTKDFMPTIGDGDLTALTKMKANYVAPGGKTEIYFNPSADFSIGLHDINAIYDRDKSLAKNAKLTPNALRADVGVKSRIPNSDLTMTNNASYTTTNLGSLVGVTSAISGNSGTAFITYQRPTRAMSGGKINVLPASTERLGAGYEGSPLKKHKELKTKAAAGYDFTQKSPYAQGALQYTIPKKKKKPVVNE